MKPKQRRQNNICLMIWLLFAIIEALAIAFVIGSIGACEVGTISGRQFVLQILLGSGAVALSGGLNYAMRRWVL